MTDHQTTDRPPAAVHPAPLTAPLTPRPRRRDPLAALRRAAVPLAAAAVLGYLLLPSLVVLVFSFNDPAGRYNHRWREFSTDAWTDPCAVAELCSGAWLSLRIALAAAAVSTVLGALAAVALSRWRLPGRRAAGALLLLPPALPEVVLAASLATLLINLRVPFGFWTVLIAHITCSLSYTVVAVKASLDALDPAVEAAARDLYATGRQVLLRVVLPLAAPGIAAGALLAFALSLDDFVVTQFTSGTSVTFPLYVWGAAQRGTPPQINVVGTAMFLLSLAAVAAAQALAFRRRTGVAR